MRLAVTGALLVGGLVAVSAPAAQADDFTPMNSPPSISSVTVPSTMQPAFPRSSAVYEVDATVGSSATVADIDTVTMCMSLEGTSDTCANASVDPTSQFLMTWDGATDTFGVTGTNNYADATSTSGYGDGSALTMAMKFKFHVSDAMKAGYWDYTIRAQDGQGQWSEEATGGFDVNYYGSVQTPRNAVDYGILPDGGSAVGSTVSDGAFVTNGESDVTFQATDFTGPGADLTLANGLPFDPVSPGQVALDCGNGTAGDFSSATRLSNSPQTMVYWTFGGGTGETPVTGLSNTCRLTYGGGATVANQQYSNVVTVGVGQAF